MNDSNFNFHQSTCKMVSKLNVKPFHRVNSPLDAPVMRRLPSGVHCKNELEVNKLKFNFHFTIDLHKHKILASGLYLKQHE